MSLQNSERACTVLLHVHIVNHVETIPVPKVKENDLVLIFHVICAIFFQLNSAGLHLIPRTSSQTCRKKFARSAYRVTKWRIVIPLLKFRFANNALIAKVSDSLGGIIDRKTTFVNFTLGSKNKSVCTDCAAVVQLRLGKLIQALGAYRNSQLLQFLHPPKLD